MGSGGQVRPAALGAVSAADWEKLSHARVCFGRQSVGYSILDGLSDIMKESPRARLEHCGDHLSRGLRQSRSRPQRDRQEQAPEVQGRSVRRPHGRGDRREG